MNKKCFDPHVVVFNPSAYYTLDGDLRAAGVTVHVIPENISNTGARMLWIFRLLWKLRPQVIHSWTLHDNAYAGVMGFMAGVPGRVGSVRGSLATSNFWQFSPLLRWLILYGVQSHLVNSESIAAQLREIGIPARRIRVIPNCVETCIGQEFKKINGIPQGARLVGMVANLRQVKNPVMFVRGLARILPEHPDLYGVMIGQAVPISDPEVPGQIQAAIDELDIQGRIFVDGFHADVQAVLPNFEIFCLTSTSEGTPNAILEAMAAGLPVVATRVGGIPHIVQDGITGLLVDSEDVEGLASALEALLRDPERARQMGAAGRKRVVENFNCQRIARVFEEYYLSQFSGVMNASHG
jgi:glycosyltransferase involved in cell wall biosynthesis